MRTKLLFAFMILSIAAFGQQNPIQIDANGLTQTLTAGGVVTRGQIVKINSAGQVVPVLTTDTSGAIGIAATSQTSAGNGIAVSIQGTPLVQIDSGGCAAGNFVAISTTTAGAGHCSSTSGSGQIGVALSISSPGSNFWNVALSLGSGGGSSTPTGVFTVPTTNLMADYQMQTTESVCTLTDYSSNARNATGCHGTNPTLLAGSGGVNFAGADGINLPTSLNSALTMFFVISFQGLGQGQHLNAMVDGSTACCTNSTAFRLSDWTGSSSTQPSAQGANFRLSAFSTNVETMSSGPLDIINGTMVLALTMAAANHVYINGVEVADYGSLTVNSSAGLMTTGNYVLGGNATNTSVFQGKIYRAVFYSDVKSATVVQQISQLLQEQMNARGITLSLGPGSVGISNTAIFLGDSITKGFGVTFTWPGLLINSSSFNNFFTNIYNNSVTGMTAAQLNPAGPTSRDTVIFPNSTRDMAVLWAGTNDVAGGGLASTAAINVLGWTRSARKSFWKSGLITMISRTGQDTNKNSLNALLRNYQDSADFIIDIGGTTQLGADGANASTIWFQADNIHPNQNAVFNVLAYLIGLVSNRQYGNRNFTTATTYTSAAAAAVATTSGSESGNVVTINFAGSSACLAGTLCTCTGITPAGYNQTYYIVTPASATTLTAWNNTSGLGAITVQGSCSIPEQQDVDAYTILNFGAGNFTLETCQAQTGQRIYIKNINAASSTIVSFPAQTGTNTPWTAELIDGATTLTIAQNQTRILESTLTSAAAGGCSWRVIQ